VKQFAAHAIPVKMFATKKTLCAATILPLSGVNEPTATRALVAVGTVLFGLRLI
jgi:hypothetical protein